MGSPYPASSGSLINTAVMPSLVRIAKDGLTPLVPEEADPILAIV